MRGDRGAGPEDNGQAGGGMTPLSRDEKRIPFPPNQRRCRFRRMFMFSHVLGLHTRGGLLQVRADPKSCGLFDAPTRKLTIVNVHKRNGVHKWPRLKKPGPWIFYPPCGGSEILNKRQGPFDQFIGVQQFVYAHRFCNEYSVQGGLAMIR